MAWSVIIFDGPQFHGRFITGTGDGVQQGSEDKEKRVTKGYRLLQRK